MGKQESEHYQIVDFLNECEESEWDLDADDIRHILKLDFDYVRNQNKIILYCSQCNYPSEKAHYEDGIETICPKCGNNVWLSNPTDKRMLKDIPPLRENNKGKV